MSRAYRTLPSASELWKLFDYSVITGKVFYKTGTKKGCPVGGHSSKSKHRINVRINNTAFGLHQVVWKMVTGTEAGMRVDHADKNPHNNAWLNLRLATHAQNMKNRKNIKGCYKHSTGKGWVAQITNDGQWQYLGYFSTQAEAEAAHKKASLELHGAFSPYSDE